MTFDIRTLGTDHAKDMAALHTNCFKESWGPSFFINKLKESCFALGAFLKSDFIGFIFVQRVENEAEILTFCIEKKYRKQGVGEALLLSVVKQSKILTCFLEVSSQNSAAIALYKKVGFKKQGVRKGYYHHSQKTPQNALLYVYSKKQVYL